MIPAVADLVGVPVEDVQKAWKKAKKNKKACVLYLAGDLPPMKKCPVCEINMRQDATECKICSEDASA